MNLESFADGRFVFLFGVVLSLIISGSFFIGFHYGGGKIKLHNSKSVEGKQ